MAYAHNDAYYNQQLRGRGEYNNHDDNKENQRERGGEHEQQQQRQQQQQQQQNFVAPSLCIARTHANIRRERIFAVFRSLGLGWIGRVDIVEKQDENGAPFIRVFIHFTKWFPNSKTREFLQHLETQPSANIVYDEPWYWKVTKSFVPAPQPKQQPSRFPRPRIDLVGPTTTTTTTTVSISKPKTPSSASASTNAATTAVSGKGKQVAKRMGYESGKGLGKKADGRIVPVQIQRNIGRNGIGLGSRHGAATAAAAAPSDDVHSSSEYWTKVAEATTALPTAERLSVSVSPPKIERRLFCDENDDESTTPRLAKST